MNAFEKPLTIDTASSNTTKNADKNFVTTNLKENLNLREYENVEICLSSFEFTNLFVNVYDGPDIDHIGYNDRIYFSDDPLNVTKYWLEIIQGCYTVEHLSELIQFELNHQGFPNIFHLEQFEPINKVMFVFGAAGWYVHLAAASSPYLLLGYDGDDYIPANKISTANQYCVAPNQANFNLLTNIKIKTNLTNGYLDNGQYSNLLDSLVPTSKIGNTERYELYNLLWITSNELKCGLSQVLIEILDQNDNP